MTARPKIISVAEWGGNNKKSTARMRGRSGLGFHYNGNKLGIFLPDQYPAVVRGIERFHEVDRGWADIAYNWLVSPHGQILEGRGAFVRSAANGTNWGNDNYEAIMYLGGVGDPFTDQAKYAIWQLTKWRQAEGVGPELRPHDFFKPTACPGDVKPWLLSGMPIPHAGTPAPNTGVPMGPLRNISLKLPDLTVGSRGAHVQILQTLLAVKAGQTVTADGHFGPQTQAAVDNVQRFFKLKDTSGVASAQTWHVLLELP